MPAAPSEISTSYTDTDCDVPSTDVVTSGQLIVNWARGAPASSVYTDWAEIVALYDLLLRAAPSPVVELNRAAAVAMRDGPAAGLALVELVSPSQATTAGNA